MIPPTSNRLLAALIDAEPRRRTQPAGAVVGLLGPPASGASSEIAVVGNEAVVGTSQSLGAVPGPQEAFPSPAWPAAGPGSTTPEPAGAGWTT